MVVLYFVGRRLEKRQAAQMEQIEAAKQNVTMLVIDKKKMKLKDANLPASVMAQVPKISRGIKVPMVKVKIGPQIMTMFCDENIFEQIPVKKEVKATISGNYITGVKGVHGTKLEEKSKKKKGVFKRALEKAQEKAGVKPLK
jgi:uncharacterized protein with ATP-grasp and redox domains